YVIGGATTQPWAKENFLSFATPQRGLGTVQAYDPATNTWKELTPMPTPRNHAAIGVVNGKVYVIGGRVGAAFISLASDTSLVEVYDPATDTWGTPGARMPTTRSALAYGVYNNRIYIAAGSSRIRCSRRRSGRSKPTIRRPTRGVCCRRWRLRVTGSRQPLWATGSTLSAAMCSRQEPASKC